MTSDSWPCFAAAWRRWLKTADRAAIDAFLAGLTAAEARRLVHAWPLWARSTQLPPSGRWRVWLMMAGRGFGKTRAGAEWVKMLAESGSAGSIALVGEVPQATGFMSSQVEWTPVCGSFFDGSGSGFDVLIGRDILCQGVFTMSFDGHVTFSR